MKKRPLPDAEYLRSLFAYDEASGVLTWTIKKQSVQVGRIAGSITRTGYRSVKIDYIDYQSHNVIWKMVTGRDPDPELDHINLIRDDNRWENLREVTHSHNCANKRMNSLSRNPYKGIWQSRTTRKWYARLQVRGQRFLFGYFNTPEEAHAVYLIKAREYFGASARIR